MELAIEENTLLALDPINWTVPTTMIRTTASMTAYSATSCPFLIAPKSAYKLHRPAPFLFRDEVERTRRFWDESLRMSTRLG